MANKIQKFNKPSGSMKGLVKWQSWDVHVVLFFEGEDLIELPYYLKVEEMREIRCRHWSTLSKVFSSPARPNKPFLLQACLPSSLYQSLNPWTRLPQFIFQATYTWKSTVDIIATKREHTAEFFLHIQKTLVIISLFPFQGSVWCEVYLPSITTVRKS